MNQIKQVACLDCNGSTLAMEKDSKTIMVWCPCREENPSKRNSVLEDLRREGWDVGPDLFHQKTKSEQTAGKLAGKFKDQEALECGWENLCKVAGVRAWEAEAMIKATGSMEAAYLRLQTNWSKRRMKVKG